MLNLYVKIELLESKSWTTCSTIRKAYLENFPGFKIHIPSLVGPNERYGFREGKNWEWDISYLYFYY
jgi:hypothetical protein